MKIKDIKTFVVGNKSIHRGGPYWVFVKVTTDCGTVGYGEIYGVAFHPKALTAMIDDMFERHFAGTDPFKIERHFRLVYSAGFSQRPDPTVMGIFSGIEMALWDIIGKALDKPIYELLGGQVHERLRSYTYLNAAPDAASNQKVYDDPDAAAERALEYVAQGFTALKFDPARPYTAFDPRQLSMETLDFADRYTARVREAVGASCDILIGTHGEMSPSGALRLARKLEPHDPLWFEEPTPPDNISGMALVAAGTRIPVATGERLTTKYEFADLLRQNAASILQMNLGRVGGILEAKKIASMGEAFHAQIAPHLFCGPLVGAANIQVSACSPNFLIMEGIEQWGGFQAEILKTPIRWEDGYVIPPTAPGLGVELDEAVAEANPYTGERLQLRMKDTPA
ncbi:MULTISPECIES: mandelate racemase/muconate lactonizing enzyme family protein [unclassified Sulfitobacter]|jgi:2-dehydro-3-deoxyphosphogalactonate aldolase|uniref:mandelate racemase/muconate lactonizing enzyme family protein n=1 Tax=unclassified Sulfitobacter TaxID=196795 RepID=UPI0007C40429|nr:MULTISPECIES: mandelate racemase/muconate lactonizing enzyme family protein [unclassified Sulfitobacter]KZX95161.1 isomerase [Sulfitobacter sp. HI0021]KZX95539.1 isomerase [Sulfitobacter sp. HI0027]KZY99791.1 isomerase [Sulfitobacter sp. HI0076]WPZ29731.1 mandelate racemase/muconate lactonizing enzyme family protein [Sulfitobacter sp. OXR-159]